MSDILVRNMPAEMKRQIENRARAHKRGLSGEITALLRRALAQVESEGAEPKLGLGTRLAAIFPKEHNYDDFVLPPRDEEERPPPSFD
jgi:plasmid stability protein